MTGKPSRAARRRRQQNKPCSPRHRWAAPTCVPTTCSPLDRTPRRPPPPYARTSPMPLPNSSPQPYPGQPISAPTITLTKRERSCRKERGRLQDDVEVVLQVGLEHRDAMGRRSRPLHGWPLPGAKRPAPTASGSRMAWVRPSAPPFRLAIGHPGIGAPLRSTPITELPHYYGRPRPCSLHRYWSSRVYRFGGFPCHQRAGSPVPPQSPCPVPAAFMPVTVWPICRHPPDSSQAWCPILVLVTSDPFRHVHSGLRLFSSEART